MPQHPNPLANRRLKTAAKRGNLFCSGRSLCEVIRDRVGSHGSGYLRYPSASKHLHHLFEISVCCLQTGRYDHISLFDNFFLKESKATSN
jgi:hypothetical protein